MSLKIYIDGFSKEEQWDMFLFPLALWSLEIDAIQQYIELTSENTELSENYHRLG